MSTGTFLYLPPEILDKFVDHVDDYEDVLAMALTCKALCSVAIPRHLHYRDIRATIWMSDLWLSFARPNDRNAAGVRSLTILPSNDAYTTYYKDVKYHLEVQRVPTGYRSPPSFNEDRNTDLELSLQWEKNLVAALQNMINLRQFRWLRRPALGEAKLWNTLQTLGSVRGLHLMHLDLQQHPIPVIPPASLLSFSGLTSFNWHTGIQQSISSTDMTKLSDMLINNHGLQSLSMCTRLYVLGLTPVDALFDRATWPNLRTLRLRGFRSNKTSLVRFLVSHPTLEDLETTSLLEWRTCSDISLPDGALPNLRRLHCPSFFAIALLKNTLAAAKLECIEGVELHKRIVMDGMIVISPWRDKFLACLKNLSFIRSMALSGLTDQRELRDLSYVMPGLKKLMFERRHIHESYSNSLSLFPDLESIRDDSEEGFLEPNNGEKSIDANNKIIGQLTEACPRLKTVESSGCKAVIVGRDGGVRWVMRKSQASDRLAEVGRELEEVYCLK